MKEKVTPGKIWGIIYPGLLYEAVRTLFVFLVSVLLTIVIIIFKGYNNPDEISIIMSQGLNRHIMFITLTTAFVALPLLIFFRYRDIQKDKLNDRHKKYERVFFLKYILIVPFAIFFMMSANYLVTMLTLIMPESMTRSYEDTATYIYSSSMPLQILAAGIVCPIAEELIYRALVYNRIKKLTNIIPAAIVSSFMFGVFHGNWIQAPYAFLIGMGCVFVYEKYKSMAAPILLHMAANLFAVMLTSMQSAVATTEAAEALGSISNGEMFVMCAMYMIFMGVPAFILSLIINKIVNPKEIIK